MLIGLSGFAGSGKDSVGDALLVDQKCAKVALADPLKRIAREVYDFSYEQLWGPSEERNKPDMRYPRHHTYKDGVCLCCGDEFYALGAGDIAPCYLTPRYALQTLGTEWGRHCYEDTWIDLGIRTANKLLEDWKGNNRLWYYPNIGLGEPVEPSNKKHLAVVFSDIRFRNEITAIKQAGGKVVRIKRAGLDKPSFDHRSETEQAEIPDTVFDYILENDSSLHSLQLRSLEMLDVLSGRILPYDAEQADIPPFKRK